MHRFIAIVAVLLLGAAAFLATRPRAGKTSAPSRHVAAPTETPAAAASPVGFPTTTDPATAPANADAPVPPPPWPLEFPPASWPEPVRRTWEKLRQRVTLDFANANAAQVVEWLSSELGVPIHIDPALLRELQSRAISMRVSQIIADGCMKLMLGPAGLGFEIQDDGSIRIAKEDQVARRYEKEGGAILARRQSMEHVTEFLSKGWNGTEYELDPVARECRERLRGPGTVAAHNEPLEDVVARLRETTALNIVIDAGLRDEMGRVTATSTGTLQEILDEVARSAGVGVCMADGVVLFTRIDTAERSRASEVEARRAHEADLTSLAKPVRAGSMTVADFAKALEAATGLPVMPSKELWGGGAAISIPSGATARAALEGSGMRWAVYGGRIWLVK